MNKGKGPMQVWNYFGFYKVIGKVNRTETVCKICHAVKPDEGGNTSNI